MRESKEYYGGNGRNHDHEPLSKMSSSEIREEILHTREELEHTIDELKHIASPEEIARTVVSMMRGGPGQFLTNFGRSVRDNPLPVAVTAMGLIWLMASETDHAAGEEIELEFDDDEESRIGGAIEGAKDRASELAHDVRQRARGAGQKARQTFDRQMDDNPLVLGAIGVAVGALLGGALPRTRTEDRTLGRVGDRTRERVRQVVREEGERIASSTRSVGGRPNRGRTSGRVVR